ncbi:MAG: 4-hydroxy-tetrahydrodipicolinate reductase [Clostridia bacterium]|nr:4-hydroxy-tetrahydrodipicolinate reductase [Clostridia bacterium]
MKIIVNGALGFMGREVVRLCREGYRGASLAGACDKNADGSDGVADSLKDITEDADCLVDFSHHLATKDIIDYAAARKMPLVIATTGQDNYELAMIKRAAETIPVFHSANMSLGIALLCELAVTAAKAMPDADIEIVEVHHNRKLDAPSGTALMLADEIKSVRENADFVYGRHGNQKRTATEIGIHALRLGNVVGEHEVILATATQKITLRHEAQTRSLFAEGAVAAAGFLIGQRPGLYTMKDIVGNK